MSDQSVQKTLQKSLSIIGVQITNIDGELVIDGHYSFLKDDGESLKSGFLGADTPLNIVEDLENRYP